MGRVYEFLIETSVIKHIPQVNSMEHGEDPSEFNIMNKKKMDEIDRRQE